ncbi:MAG: 3-oxoacyl-[acyl-carrier protein] reductase [Acidobacteriota bacterium]|nr:3-oxoacyl-[acyl-carrier protein] reductase [Acidobacteriota bacterium]
MIDLTDYRVLVTGGSRGIGAACCRLFAQAGAAVMVQYLASGARAKQVLDEIEGISSQPHRKAHCDVTDCHQIGELFDFVRSEWGGLDGLVNNAGVWIHDPLVDLDKTKLEATLAVNVVGPFLCARQAVPLLQESHDGSIINISSTAGQRGEAFYSPYAASKGAMISATKSWSTELAPRIRVNAVAPGWVDTDMTAEALAGDGREKALAAIPLQRIATAEDIAGAVLFLASPLARHITGEILNVNGGSVLIG